MKKKKMRLKGKLRLYMNWPLIMTFLLVAMNIWVLMVDLESSVYHVYVYPDLSGDCWEDCIFITDRLF